MIVMKPMVCMSSDGVYGHLLTQLFKHLCEKLRQFLIYFISDKILHTVLCEGRKYIIIIGSFVTDKFWHTATASGGPLHSIRSHKKQPLLCRPSHRVWVPKTRIVKNYNRTEAAVLGVLDSPSDQKRGADHNIAAHGKSLRGVLKHLNSEWFYCFYRYRLRVWWSIEWFVFCIPAILVTILSTV